MYKQYRNRDGSVYDYAIERLSDGAFIPFDPANTDYQKFKTDVAAGVPLEDPDGNVMTQGQVDEFLRTIP